MRHVTRLLATALAMALLHAPAAGQDPNGIGEGAQVWGAQCVRCHNARPSAERTDLQWLVIVNHMRARANLTKGQARAVTAFLQATNLPETAVAAPELQPEPAGEDAEARKEAKSERRPGALRRLLSRLPGG